MANLVGAFVGAAWVGFGTVIIWFVLNKTKLLEGHVLNYGITSSDLRKYFKLIAALGICGGAIFGWFAGEDLFGETV